MDLRISFLFGAGISFDSIPKSKDLDNIILKEKGPWVHNENLFIPDRDPAAHKTVTIDDKKYNVVNLLKEYRKILQKLYEIRNKLDSSSKNYEDILYYLYDIDLGFRFSRKPIIMKYFDKKFNYKTYTEYYNENHFRFINSYIVSIIYDVLKEITSFEHLSNLIKILKKLENWNIFTLNHDLVLETLFSSENIKFTDGFYPVNMVDNITINGKTNHQLWKFNEIDSINNNLLLKLHGSINWFTLLKREDKKLGETVGYIKLNDLNDIHSDVNYNGKEIHLGLPLFLSGVDNKLESYNYGLYLRQQYLFFKILLKTDVLVCSGYSFGDYAISLKIIDWLVNNKNAKVIIITPSKSSTICNAKGVIKERFGNWDNQRFFFIEKGIENIEISDFS